MTMPGTTALADVAALHVPPMLVEAEFVHADWNGSGMSTTVAGSFRFGPLNWSLIRMIEFTCSCPE